MRYRIDILRNYVPIGTLAVTECSVKFDSNAKIKRGASIATNMRMMELSAPSFERMSDRVSPVIIDDFGVEHREGIYMIVSDPVSYGGAVNLTTLELYDESYILDQTAFDSRHFYAAGIPYTDVFSNILTECGLVRQVIEPSDGVLAVDREFAVGDNALDVLNTLLEEAGYYSLYMNADGYACCDLKKTATQPSFVYKSGDSSNIRTGVSRNIDIYGIPNVFVGVVSTPEQAVMMYKAENHNPNSELSIERRGYKLAKVYKLDGIASQRELEAYVTKLLNDSMTALQKVSFSTAIETGHEFQNCIQIEHEDLSGLYIEKSWTYTLGTAESMTHNAEKKVLI